MKMIEAARMPQPGHARIPPWPQAESACRRHHEERVKKLKMADCRPFIFNGLEHAQSPVFEFFHAFESMSPPPRASIRDTEAPFAERIQRHPIARRSLVLPEQPAVNGIVGGGDGCAGRGVVYGALEANCPIVPHSGPEGFAP